MLKHSQQAILQQKQGRVPMHFLREKRKHSVLIAKPLMRKTAKYRLRRARIIAKLACYFCQPKVSKI